MNSSPNNMVSIIFILIPTLALYVCEAQVVTTTSTVGISTTITETATIKFLLELCVSQLDGPCPQKPQRHQPSLYETIFPPDSGAFLNNPSAVEKMEVTQIDPGVGRLPFGNQENYIITQSSLKEEDIFDHYGSSIGGLQLHKFFFVRPFENLWSSFVRATSTVYQTVTSTFFTTSYVESTASTSTLFIKKCENPAGSEILLKTLPKCQQDSSTASSTTESTTEAGTLAKTTDEIGYSCRSRIDSIRLCDGIFDCPGGEDEAASACGGCDETNFTCENPLCISRNLLTQKCNKYQPPECIPLSQRCDGKVQCSNGMDEALCNILSPTQTPTKNQTLVPKFRSGYVMQNIEGKYYPLCVDTSKDTINIDELALRICLMAVGNTTIEEIKYEIQTINQSEYDGKYAVSKNDPVRPFLVADQCPTSQLLSVSCPAPLCISRNGPTLKNAILEANATFNSVPTATSSNGAPRIANGTDAAEGAWPWVVAIIENGTHKCGGTLVSSSWIVTAAHCFKQNSTDTSFENNYYEAQLSMLRNNSLSPLEQIGTVHRIFVHPDYNDITNYNDIALLTVKEPFQLNQWAAPICLPSPDDRPTNGTVCTVVGWGRVAFKGPVSDPLQQVSIPLTSCDTMTTDIPPEEKIHAEEKFICAGLPEGGQASCPGDSGGPLVCPDPKAPENWIFAGVVSFGPRVCAAAGEPAGFTRVTHHLGWINKTMNNMDETQAQFPLKTCPGITCQKGLGTCLPCKHVCDGVVDCFGAEDEINAQCDKCLETSSAVFPGFSLFLNPIRLKIKIYF